MVFLAQGPRPFVSRSREYEYNRADVKCSKIINLYNISNENQIQSSSEIPVKDTLMRFDFSSSLFLNFSEEKLTSFEGPPAAKALLAFSAWIQ